jgi:hypothetical protein
LEGKTLLIYENIKTYLNQLFKVDIGFAPFTLVGLEAKYNTKIEIEANGATTQLIVGGKIDRIDNVNGSLRVLDYKTGNVKSKSFKEVDELFTKDLKDPKKEVLQAMVYTWVLRHHFEDINIAPGIYGLKDLFKEDFNPEIRWEKHEFSFDELKDGFESGLKNLLEEIYSTDTTFVQTPHIDHCKYCAYNTICQRF